VLCDDCCYALYSEVERVAKGHSSHGGTALLITTRNPALGCNACRTAENTFQQLAFSWQR